MVGCVSLVNFLIKAMRDKAKVSGINEALSQCEAGKNKIIVTVMNNPDNDTSIWVIENKSKKGYWMPKSNLDRKVSK